MERLEIIPVEDPLISIGRSESARYYLDASKSDVPASFLRVSTVLIHSFFPPDMPVSELSEMLFGQRFESDQETWAAIKYAEAIAATKTFHANLMYDSEGPIVTRSELDNLFLMIGVSVMNERPHPGFGIKEIVEYQFDPYENPANRLRIEYLAKTLEKIKTH